MGRLIAKGKYLFDGKRKFYARGVSYGTFARNSRGEPFPEPERAAADFALMRELGANVVRTYEPPPPWMIEQAAKCGLRVMLGIPWPSHLAFLDSREMVRDIRSTIQKAVLDMRSFGEPIFAYTLGNEIRSDIVRWHSPRRVGRFLAELYDLGKQLDPEGLFTYASYPSTEYLELRFLDFLSFNVYLHREDDFRRYLTHLMAISGELPLVLSETGMDTIREGEEQQAELLGWQTRAAFELGLSGFVVFAFTDEWYRGGSEITDWAFGLVTRERRKKPAFSVVAEVFKSALPPPLESAPKASVVVAAYNARETLGACLASVADLNYPDYETIVVDDGSSDSTASIAEAAGVRLLRREHRGLAAARNAGADAARGEIVAFIDADARADRDWLYHLVETVVRRQAAAAGGPNFGPPPQLPVAAAIAAAPGPPREVPLGDDTLAQLCGCNMAVEKSALKKLGGFDPMFTAAGDDVDLSWRLRENGATLASAAGAIVIHDRRSTVGGYLAQQRGYGAAEGLLLRKYPLRNAPADGLYGGASWLSGLLGAGRIYYGAFGRGLFQSLYPTRDAPAVLQVPLSIQWIGAALILIGAGTLSDALGALGCIGVTISLACTAIAAMAAPLDRAHSGPFTRATLATLCLLGPLMRSIERERIRLRFEPRREAFASQSPLALQIRGEMAFSVAESNGAAPIASKPLLEALRAALVRRGLAVARSDGFQSYDLQILIPPAIKVPINALDEGGGRSTIRWRLEVARGPVALSFAALVAPLLIAGASWRTGIAVVALAALAFLALAAARVRFIPATLEASAQEVSSALGLRVATSDLRNA